MIDIILNLSAFLGKKGWTDESTLVQLGRARLVYITNTSRGNTALPRTKTVLFNLIWIGKVDMQQK